MKKRIIFSTLFCFFSLLVAKQLYLDGNSSRGKLYIIGTGPAGPQMATLQALDVIKNMNVFVASEDHLKLFKDYVGKKPILFDPWKGLFTYKGKRLRQLNMEEITKFSRERSKMIEDRVKRIKNHLTEGKNVGLLDNGNPLLFGPSNFYAEEFDSGDIVIIPGMGSDAAALAALGKSVLPAHDACFLLQSSPFYLMDHRMGRFEMFKNISQNPSSVILYMALQMPERLFGLLNQVYPPDMPCAVVFWAGYPDKQRIVKGTIADMASKLKDEKERYMGLLLIGRFLEGKPYNSAIR